MKKWTKVLCVLILGCALLLSGEVPGTEAQPVPGTYYYIQSVASGKYLDLETRSMLDGIYIVQRGVPRFGFSRDTQQWMLIDMGGDNYKLKNRYSNRVMDLNGSTANGGLVQEYLNLPSRNLTQEFYFTDAKVCSTATGCFDVGTYYIYNAFSVKVLDVNTGCLTCNGTRIQQWDKLGGENQKWRFIEAQDPLPSL